MTQTKDSETEGLMTVRDVCAEYGITRAQAVNIMAMIPVKLQKHRANWFTIEDVEKLMERHRRMWDRDYFANNDQDHYDEEQEAELILSQIKAVIKSDKRRKSGKRTELESYTDYPDAVKNNAKRGIEMNAEVNNKCATEVGKIRAQQLAQGKPISVETIKRMHSYLSRAEEYYDENDTKACGTISYLLWGGLAGKRWAESKLKELGKL